MTQEDKRILRRERINGMKALIAWLYSSQYPSTAPKQFYISIVLITELGMPKAQRLLRMRRFKDICNAHS